MRELAPGVVVAGYRIESLVGRGGMGVVYRAVQEGLERIVALKVIAPELLDDEDVRARFLSEARAAASVDHPNVIPVHAAGEENGVAYIAMRYVSGSDLRSLVRHGGALDAVEAAGFVAQAGAALDAIHRAGFVHRDVKPANLLVDLEGHVYVTDFGLAKTTLSRTSTGHWVGTLDYVAPEQIRGGRIDARADVYALGGVLHYALTGRVPFERDGDEAKLWAQLSAPPPAPTSLRRSLRGQFDAVVARAMAKEAETRYPSAGDLGRAAQAAAAGREPSEPERMVARGAAAPEEAKTEPGLAVEVSTRTARPKPHARRRAPLVAAVSTLVVGGGVVVAVLARGEEPPPQAKTTATATPSPSPGARVAQTVERVGDRPGGIALAGGDLWVISRRESRLTRIDGDTGRERGQHTKVGLDAAGIVGSGDDLWVALGTDQEVVRLDARSGKVKDRWPVDGAPRRFDVNRDGVWVGVNDAAGGGRVLRYDRRGELMQSIPVAEGVGGLLATPNAIWVVKRDTRKLARLKIGDHSLVDWAELPGDVRSLRYGDGAVWAVLDQDDTVVRVDERGGRMITTSAGRSPAEAIVADDQVYVASRNDNTVVPLEPGRLGAAGKPIPVGLNPVAMIADDRSVWVLAVGDNNTLTRIAYR